MEVDLLVILQEYGPFIALVIYVILDNRQREAKYRKREEDSIIEDKARESRHVKETREREKKYIEREERYISIVESLTSSFKGIEEDVNQIKERIGVK